MRSHFSSASLSSSCLRFSITTLSCRCILRVLVPDSTSLDIPLSPDTWDNDFELWHISQMAFVLLFSYVQSLHCHWTHEEENHKYIELVGEQLYARINEPFPRISREEDYLLERVKSPWSLSASCLPPTSRFSSRNFDASG